MWKIPTGGAGGPSKAKKMKNGVVQVCSGNSSLLSGDSFRNEGLTHHLVGSAACRHMPWAVSVLPGLPLLKSLSEGLPTPRD